MTKDVGRSEAMTTDKQAVERVRLALVDCMNRHGMNDDTYIAPEDQDPMARAALAALAQPKVGDGESGDVVKAALVSIIASGMQRQLRPSQIVAEILADLDMLEALTVREE